MNPRSGFLKVTWLHKSVDNCEYRIKSADLAEKDFDIPAYYILVRFDLVLTTNNIYQMLQPMRQMPKKQRYFFLKSSMEIIFSALSTNCITCCRVRFRRASNAAKHMASLSEDPIEKTGMAPSG